MFVYVKPNRERERERERDREREEGRQLWLVALEPQGRHCSLSLDIHATFTRSVSA